MKRKAFSLIIVPHSLAKSKTFSFSRKAFKIIAGAAFFIFLLSCFILVDYISMSGVRRKYDKLFQESLVQRETLDNYRTTVEQLQKTVESFEDYAKKLNVMAGLKDPGVKEVGIGDGIIFGRNPEPAARQDFSLTRVRSINQKAGDLEKNLNTLVMFFENQSARLACTPTIWPTKGWVVSTFGPRTDPFTGKPAFHYGIDIATNQGNPIYATADGTVISVRTDKIGGKYVIISHGRDITSAYLHLDKFLVREGQRVKRGDVIGLVGRTGKALGPHVHYEVRISGKSVNPYNYILEEE